MPAKPMMIPTAPTSITLPCKTPENKQMSQLEEYFYHQVNAMTTKLKQYPKPGCDQMNNPTVA